MVLGIRDSIVVYLHRSEVADQLFLLKFIQTEAISPFGRIVVVLDVCDDSTVHLQLHIVGRRVLSLLLIHVFKVLSDDSTMWYHVCRQRVGECREHDTRQHVWSHQTLEGSSGSEDSDNF